MGVRGDNRQSYASFEELNHLRVAPDAPVPYLYKRLDKQTHLPVEERTYQLRIPVPNTKGVRKSLKTPDRHLAVAKAEEDVLALRVLLKQGGTALPLPVEELVEKFLRTKKSRIRGNWVSKEEAGRRSITQERYNLIAGKLRNYLVPFLGAKTDARRISFSKWNDWEMWRVENTRKGERPKAITIQNEMGMLRECWKWGMNEGLLPFSPKLPFHEENLITNDKVRRDTWEPHEWHSFARLVREWLKAQKEKAPADYWDAWVAYQMLFFLSNCGMRVGELVKVKRKDIEFYERNVGEIVLDKQAKQSVQKKVDARLEQERRDGVGYGEQTEFAKKNFSADGAGEMVVVTDFGFHFKQLCALVQVHPSTKTGAREVNAMGGVFARRVWEKTQFKRKEDFLFCHLDGTPFTTKQFRKQFEGMVAFTDEDARWGKHFVPYSLRHFYATIRLQHGTTRSALCENMGVTEPYLRKHYSHYLTRLATADLMKMDKAMGLGGKLIPEGEDFVVPDVT